MLGLGIALQPQRHPELGLQVSRLVASFGPPRLFLTRPIPCRIDEDALVIRFYAAKPIAAEEELTIFFEKLAKYIGTGTKELIDSPDGRRCFRLHRDRVFYVSEHQVRAVSHTSAATWCDGSHAAALPCR